VVGRVVVWWGGAGGGVVGRGPCRWQVGVWVCGGCEGRQMASEGVVAGEAGRHGEVVGGVWQVGTAVC